MRPALKYNGAKWLMAPWILKHLPPHDTYVEPFGGSAAILLRKPVSDYEIYNDLDGNVVNFFRVLREKPRELIRAIRFTPYSRAEFVACLDFEADVDDVESARRFYALCWMGMDYNPRRRRDVFKLASGFRVLAHNAGGGAHKPADLFRRVNHLARIAIRLKKVQIENRSWRQVLESVHGTPNLLVYCDPPYLIDTDSRRADALYEHEMTEPAEHVDFLETIADLGAMVVVSGLRSNLYLDALPGWAVVSRMTVNRKRRPVEECLYLNPQVVEALDEMTAPLFRGVQ